MARRGIRDEESHDWRLYLRPRSALTSDVTSSVDFLLCERCTGAFDVMRATAEAIGDLPHQLDDGRQAILLPPTVLRELCAGCVENLRDMCENWIRSQQ